jgi:neutral ceramidase
MTFKKRSIVGRLPAYSVVLMLLCCGLANAAEMKAGVAKVDITPPLGTHMWGYFDRMQGAEGIMDPLYARVLVLQAGDQRLAYVDLDLGRTFGQVSLDQLRAAVKKDTGISNVIVQATHTHAGPVILDSYPAGTPAWETTDLKKIEQAIGNASQHAVSVKLGVGYGETYIGYNRRLINSDGSVSMLWSNSTQVPTFPVDPTIAVLRIDQMDGQPLALLVNYSTHPVTFGPDNLQFSADFPGVMCKVVEQAFAGKPLAFFVQGAPGDINVYDATTPIKRDAIARRDWAGKTLGDAAASAAKAVQTSPDSNASIDVTEDILPFKLRWDPEKFHQELLKEINPIAFETFAPAIQETMHLPVTTALIDRKIALLGMPGEPFLEFQMNMRARCPVEHCFFLGYTNGYYGYFPTIKAAVEGGYGAQSATTWVQVGAGEQMENQGLIDLYRMLGRLPDSPNTDWKSLPPSH